MVTLDDVRLARERIRPYVRRTPMMQAVALNQPLTSNGHIMLKLECLQVMGSFKPRGAVNKFLGLDAAAMERGIITASGGNHGLAVAYTGWLAKKPATIYLPRTAPSSKADKLWAWGAQVVIEGDVWDEANAAALKMAERDGMAYVHPFADPAVIAGQGTIALEIVEELPDVDTMLVAIGGGGLISGISLAMKALKPSVRVIGIEPTGAPTLKESLAANAVIQLPEIKTAAGTLAPRSTAPINLEIIRDHVDEIVLVSDADMAQAAHWLWFEMGIAAELSGAAAVAALLTGQVQPDPDEKVCVLVCGAGTDGIASPDKQAASG